MQEKKECLGVLLGLGFLEGAAWRLIRSARGKSQPAVPARKLHIKLLRQNVYKSSAANESLSLRGALMEGEEKTRSQALARKSGNEWFLAATVEGCETGRKISSA